MSVGLQAIRERMAQYLEDQGVPAVTAWPGEERLRRDDPITVVSLRGCRAGPAGFQDYLGERYDQETGQWEEIYGRRTELTFGLDLYAPAETEGEVLQAAFDALADALTRGCPQGLSLVEFSCGETVYDRQARLLRRPAQAVCQAYLHAITRPGGLFVDFELRGEVKV